MTKTEYTLSVIGVGTSAMGATSSRRLLNMENSVNSVQPREKLQQSSFSSKWSKSAVAWSANSRRRTPATQKVLLNGWQFAVWDDAQLNVCRPSPLFVVWPTTSCFADWSKRRHAFPTINRLTWTCWTIIVRHFHVTSKCRTMIVLLVHHDYYWCFT